VTVNSDDDESLFVIECSRKERYERNLVIEIRTLSDSRLLSPHPALDDYVLLKPRPILYSLLERNSTAYTLLELAGSRHCQQRINTIMSKVLLYVYDLSNGMARALSLPLTGKQIDGIWLVTEHL
jgi:hypothetical protein